MTRISTFDLRHSSFARATFLYALGGLFLAAGSLFLTLGLLSLDPSKLKLVNPNFDLSANEADFGTKWLLLAACFGTLGAIVLVIPTKRSARPKAPPNLGESLLFPAPPAPVWTDELKATLIPQRPDDLKAQLLDLSPHYNAPLVESWYGMTGNDLASLPRGVQMFGGVEFDVRGVVQLGSLSLGGERFPSEIRAIRVNAKCRRLHFLHAAAMGIGKARISIGSYAIHYANEAEDRILLELGVNIWDWCDDRDFAANPNLEVAWRGANIAAPCTRLFKFTWPNPTPDDMIERIDFVSAMNEPAPFLVAVTLE